MKKTLNFLIVILVFVLLAFVAVGVIYGLNNASDLTYYEAAAATCTEDGNIEYWYDSSSGKYYADEEGTQELESVVIEATGHNYDRSGTCAVCGAEIEGLNAWGSETVYSFVYNGVSLDDHTIFYINEDDSCYYMEYGEIYYICTAEDIENGLDAVTYLISTTIEHGHGCVDGEYGLGLCWSDDGGAYILHNVKYPHIVGNDGYCIDCGEMIS